jgi:hypothetical protein
VASTDSGLILNGADDMTGRVQLYL